MPPNYSRPCPTGRARRCAGSLRMKSPNCRCIRGSLPAGSGCDYSAAASRALSRCAAAPGSSAPVIARTTTIRRAPAASTSGSRCSSIPPIANHGLSVPDVLGPTAPESDVAADAAPESDVAADAAPESDVAADAAPESDVAADAAPETNSAVARTRSRPGAGRPGLVGVGQHGPTQK